MDIEKIKSLLTDAATAGGPDYAYLFRHVPQVEKWAKKILLEYPDANSEVVLASVWLHDIGDIIGHKKNDHAVFSEKFVLDNLPVLGISNDVTKQIAHCVRAHRCRDVQPLTIEAKILAISDSLSHMTDSIYFELIELESIDFVLDKLDRDYRDKSLLKLSFSGQIDTLYQSWKSLLLALKSLS